MDDLWFDLRYAIRVLRKSPAFTLVALLTLMLGIGANVIVFGIVNSLLLRPLEVRDPDNLYQLRHQSWTSFKLLTTSWPAFEDLRERNTTFSGMAAYNAYAEARLNWSNRTQAVTGEAVSGNYFELLGIEPQIGRFFQAADEHGARSAPYLVLSDALWRNAFNADPRIIGATVRLNKDVYTVVGVAPAEFHGTEGFEWPEFWIPFVNWSADSLQNRTSDSTTVIGRLKRGVTPQQATENLNAIAAQLAKEFPKTDTGASLRLIKPGLYADNGDVIRGFLFTITGFALLVLAAAGANLAALFAARAMDRSRELAVRVALGASRSRLVRQLMTEAMVLSVVGGAAAVVMAQFVLAAIDRWQSPYGHHIVTVDARVYLAAVVFTVASGLLFGMLPALRLRKSDPSDAMKGGLIEPLRLRSLGMRDLLLGAQIAICMLLLTASLVAIRGLLRTLHAPLGFQPHGAILAEADFSFVEPNGDVSLEKKKAMLDAVRNIAGVTAAGTVSRVPFNGGLRGVPIYPPGTTEFTLNHAVLSPYVFVISPGYLEAAETRLVAGRDVSWHDTSETPQVAIVNQTFARRLWGNTPAIGQRFILRERLVEVAGVVEDGKYHAISEAPQPVVFLPLSQNERSTLIFVARSAQPQNEMAPTIERALSNLEPDAQFKVQSWMEVLGMMLLPSRAASVVLSVMGSLAAMLTVTGIFGMAAYNVSRRMKELGIRVALGARTRHVLRAAVGRPLVLLVFGSGVGLFCGILASRLLGQVVYQANPRDPIVLLGAVVIMTLLGLAASAFPAVRALAVDPSKLMRAE